MNEKDIIQRAETLCVKFVQKVENGLARSKETYAECKELLEIIKKYRSEGGEKPCQKNISGKR